MNGMLKRSEKQNRRKRKMIEIGLLAEINLTAQDAHGAHDGHGNGGESYINHHIESFLYNKTSVRLKKSALRLHFALIAKAHITAGCTQTNLAKVLTDSDPRNHSTHKSCQRPFFLTWVNGTQQ